MQQTFYSPAQEGSLLTTLKSHGWFGFGFITGSFKTLFKYTCTSYHFHDSQLEVQAYSLLRH